MSPHERAKSAYALRIATADDVETLVLHRHLMFEDIRPRTGEEHHLGDRYYRDWVATEMAKGRAVFFIASGRNGKAIASGGVWLREQQPRLSDRSGPAPYLLSMYTMPGHRRKGLGTAIVNRAEEWCSEHGYSVMTLHASKEGRILYAGLGWKRGWEMYKEIHGRQEGRHGRAPLHSRSRGRAGANLK